MAPPHPKRTRRGSRTGPRGSGSDSGEFPQRWDLILGRRLDQIEVRPRGGRFILSMIGLLCVVMIAGAVLVWKTEAWRPGEAVGAIEPRDRGMRPARAAPRHEAVVAALESARAYMTRAEWGKAEAVLTQTATEHPRDQEVRVALGETLLAQERHKDSYEQYREALTIGPRDGDLEFAAGQVASMAGMPERAADHFSRAQQADPFNPAYPLMLGMVERRLGRVDSAKASLLRAANLDPDNAHAWGSLADIALGENNLNLALQHITRARALQPESRDWRLIEARARSRRGEPENALMLLLSLEPSQRRELPVLRLISQCYGMLGRHDQAAAAWEDALGADSTNATLAFEAALAHDRAGNTAKALELARRAQMLGHEGTERLVERLSSGR